MNKNASGGIGTKVISGVAESRGRGDVFLDDVFAHFQQYWRFCDRFPPQREKAASMIVFVMRMILRLRV
jgi:hypothetical protein